jgi:hypothetical protein
MKKNSFFFLITLLVFLSGATFLAFTYLGQPQDIRNQASETCTENPVNVQFRMWTGKDTYWINGSDMHPKVGDYVEANCFAKNGSALLQSGKIVVYKGSVSPTNIVFTSTTPDMRKYQVKDAAKYIFVCSNPTQTCKDQDGFTVKASASPSPSPSPSVTPTPGVSPSPSTNPQACNGLGYGISDLNKNCKADADDYRLFLEDYRLQLSKQ